MDGASSEDKKCHISILPANQCDRAALLNFVATFLCQLGNYLNTQACVGMCERAREVKGLLTHRWTRTLPCDLPNRGCLL